MGRKDIMNIILLFERLRQTLMAPINDVRSKQFHQKYSNRRSALHESMVQRVYHQIKKVDTEATVTMPRASYRYPRSISWGQGCRNLKCGTL